MGALEESGNILWIDEAYEYSAPKFYDFINGETDEEKREAELWFEINTSYAPSPIMPRIKITREFLVPTLCEIAEAEPSQKVSVSEPSATVCVAKEIDSEPLVEKMPPIKQESEGVENVPNMVSEKESVTKETESNTPAPSPIVDTNGDAKTNGDRKTDSKRRKSAKKIASFFKNPIAALKSKGKTKQTLAKNNVANNVSQEEQAIKRQKLEEGKARQILNIKPRSLPHKTRPGLFSDTSRLRNLTTNTRKEERKMYVREPTTRYVSTAEMVNKFQSSTRDITGPIQRPKLTLTRPKEPAFETAQRVRSCQVKSFAELEEEMMAKMPKFKARPVNKKILEAPTLLAPPRSTPQLPEFKEFHLQTMSRAYMYAETSTIASSESAPHYKSASNPPVLHTQLRSRPSKLKSSIELEKEQLDNLPKFKAKPLNKKIFESKGEMGLFHNTKRKITIPQEFHFALDDRVPYLFDKLSLNHEQNIPKTALNNERNIANKNTALNPFHLHTEERGTQKERKLVMEVMERELEDERVRVRKANPYPYTTDYPVVPKKPEPKKSTEQEPFQLDSLVRHEEEMRRESEERRRVEMEEAEMRNFRAHPILKEDPIPLPEKARKPLTQVQEFNLHAENRAGERVEFVKKLKEKESKYKRYREEEEASKMMEEEKATKQLRRSLVPRARPVPSFDHPFLPHRSVKDVTKAKSPKMNVVRRKERATPSHMR